jgi:fructose-bisphosphate aldolase class 1
MGQPIVKAHLLIDTARALVAGDRGLLAMDESNPTCNKRFARLRIPQTEEAHRAYRELIVTTPGLGECISGAILCDETIRQKTKDGTPFVKVLTNAEIIPGIKVDTGAKEMAGHPGEKITEGLDGAHTLERCCEVTEEVLRTVFNELNAQRVTLEGMILKPNMVLPGLTCPRQETVDEVADATVRCLLRAVPAAVPGIAFLSGGQPAELASARLNAMNLRFKSRLPWELAFSFARAIQQPALEIWVGQDVNAKAAQDALLHRARCNRAARRGEYSAAMERTWE